MSDSICYLNGEWGPLAEAKVSVLDRGFIFGDGIYEVVPVFSGTAFRLAEHLLRLERSLAAVSMQNPLSPAQWTVLVDKLIELNQGGEQSIYIQLTRGAAPRNHALMHSVTPTVFLMSSTTNSVLESDPITAITMEDIRWQRCDIKTTSLLANVMSRLAASDLGSEEAIFIRDGYVTEGAASNIFIVVAGRIKTPPLSPRILAGVTRDLMLEILDQSELNIAQEMVTKQELLDANEVWVTSSGRELIAVVRIDEIVIGSGEIGPVFRRAQAIYQDFKQRFVSSNG